MHGSAAKSPKINVLCTDHRIQKSYFHHFYRIWRRERQIVGFQGLKKVQKSWFKTDPEPTDTTREPNNFSFFSETRNIDISKYQ